MTVKYIYQDFLLQYSSNKFSVDDKVSNVIPPFLLDYKVNKNLFDFEKMERSILLSELDGLISKKSDFDCFLELVQDVKKIFLIDDYEQTNNPIIESFKKEHLKNWVSAFLECEKEVAIYHL